MMLRTRGRDCVILPVAQRSGHLAIDRGSIESSAPTPLTLTPVMYAHQFSLIVHLNQK